MFDTPARLAARAGERIGRLPLIRSLTALGRVVAGVTVAAWLASWRLGWDEAAVVAATGLVAVVVSLLMSIGSPTLEATLQLQPRRITAGGRAAGQIVLTNSTGRRQLPSRIELPVGGGRGTFGVPSLAVDAQHDELFTIPGERRSVVTVGPVLAVRGDPLGVCRVERVLGDTWELYVHPRIANLDRLGSGFLKDLEGQTTNDLSSSDIAFHTLREYVPGDDRRHIHWRTSARIGQLMVRQYVDTRRSHLAVIISGDRAEFAHDDEFELAVSLGGSLAVRALRDEQSVSTIVGGRVIPSRSPQDLLDGLARLEFGAPHTTIDDGCLTANQLASAASIVVLLVGSTIPLHDVRVATNRIRSDARVVVVRADPAGELRYQMAGSLGVLNVPTLDDLGRGLWRVGQ